MKPYFARCGARQRRRVARHAPAVNRAIRHLQVALQREAARRFRGSMGAQVDNRRCLLDNFPDYSAQTRLKYHGAHFKIGYKAMDTQTVPPLDKQLPREFETKAANTIRMLAADGVQAANSGHPGMPMGMAVGRLTLWTPLSCATTRPTRHWAEPRPLRPQRRPRLHAALLAAASDRLRPAAGRTDATSASGAARRPATPSSATRPASRRPPARWAQGFCQRRGHGAGRALAGRSASTAPASTSSTTTPTPSSATAT